MLIVAYDEVIYPLMFTILPKRMNFNFQKSIDLLQHYVYLFGAESIKCLLADREFVGEDLIK